MDCAELQEGIDMRGLKKAEQKSVGGGIEDYPGRELTWPDRTEVEREISELLEIVEGRNRRASGVAHGV